MEKHIKCVLPFNYNKNPEGCQELVCILPIDTCIGVGDILNVKLKAEDVQNEPDSNFKLVAYTHHYKVIQKELNFSSITNSIEEIICIIKPFSEDDEERYLCNLFGVKEMPKEENKCNEFVKKFGLVYKQ
jgi:hypothetical protein